MTSDGGMAPEADKEEENNADLWRKLKAARHHLVTRTEFLHKYRSPSTPPTLNSINSGEQQDPPIVMKEIAEHTGVLVSGGGNDNAHELETAHSDVERNPGAFKKVTSSEASKQDQHPHRDPPVPVCVESDSTKNPASQTMGPGFDSLDTSQYPLRDGDWAVYDADLEPDSESESKVTSSRGRPSIAVQVPSHAKHPARSALPVESATSSMQLAQSPSAQGSFHHSQILTEAD
jgi:hypothetical protein